jgi:predicted nucleic acid-binding protein
MDNKQACCTGIVLAELIRGAKSEKELEVLHDFRNVFEFFDESIDLWQTAGELSYTLLRKGKSIGLSDCYLAATAKAHKATIFTLDKHFEVIEHVVGLALYDVNTHH